MTTYVLLTDDNNATFLVAASTEDNAEQVAAAAVFSDGGVSAWRVPTMALRDNDNLRDLLRQGYNLNYLHDVYQASPREAVLLPAEVWTLSMWDGKRVLTTLHESEAAALAHLRENYAEGDDVADGELVEWVENQGHAITLDSHRGML